MNKYNCKLYSFMKAVRGNWHNALYIPCSCSHCPFQDRGFLFAADADGQPLLIPIRLFEEFSGVSISPEECRCTLSRPVFESVYSLYIEWHTVSDDECPLRQLY